MSRLTRRASSADRSAEPRRFRWPVVLATGTALVVLIVFGYLVFFPASSANQAPWARLGSEDVHSLTFVNTDTQLLLFGHHDGVLQTADGGQTWQPLPVHEDAMGMRTAGDGSIVIAGHDVLSASHDGGRTWAPMVSDLPSLDIHGFARDPGDYSRMWAYLATGGLWESTNLGAHWTRVRDDNVLYPFAIDQPSGPPLRRRRERAHFERRWRPDLGACRRTAGVPDHVVHCLGQWQRPLCRVTRRPVSQCRRRSVVGQDQLLRLGFRARHFR